MTDIVELLAPCGNEENFYGAINYGATAIYLGLSDFSARKNAGNFTLEKLPYYVAYAHIFNVKVYVTVNTVIKNSELQKYFDFIKKANDCGVDAFIVQDIFLGRALKKAVNGITLHLSTQAGINNVDGAKQAISFGFSRVILARETTIDEIRKIAEIVETEVFVQGALCTCFSGHCYFSSFIGGKSGNRGFCRQPCRKLYKYEGKGIKDNLRYALSPCDLSLASRIKELKSAGVKSFKIEGRMRSFEYVCASCDFYNELIYKDNYSKIKFENLKKTYNRGNYTEGLSFGQKKNFISDKIQNHQGIIIGQVDLVKNGKIFLSNQKHSFKVGDCFKIITNGYESGNGTAVNENGKISLIFKGKAFAGSDIALTKDVNLIEKYKSDGKKVEINVNLYGRINEQLKLNINGKDYYSDYVVTEAKTSAVTKGELKDNLRRTDIYPYNVIPKIDIEGSLFIPKKVMNNLRSKAYENWFYSFIKKDEINDKINDNISDFNNYYVRHNNEIREFTIISDDFSFNLFKGIKNIVFCPHDYNDENQYKIFFEQSKSFNCDKFLYVPAFLNSKDEKIITEHISNFDGIYSESASGLFLARRLKKKFFAGVEMNITNNLTYNSLKESGADEISLSKELSFSELDSMNEGWVLSLGLIKLMSLIYCPFGKTCYDCKRDDNFTLRDGDNRAFPVRRYKLSDCRFEIYNQSFLRSKVKHSKEIFDFTSLSANTINNMVNIYFKNTNSGDFSFTNGNFIKGVE